MTLEFQRFSAIQYYLAHARNTVHAMADLPHTVSKDAFMALVADILSSAPQLLWRESLRDHGHYKTTDADWATQCACSAPESEAAAAAELHAFLSAPLHDTGKPAFRALCQTLPDGQGPTTRIVLCTTHALMEGGDVADLLRGRRSDHSDRRVSEANLSLGARLGAVMVAALLWPLHLLTARFETKDRNVFAFTALQFNRDDVRRVAQSLQMGQRDLVFALCSHHRGRVPTNKAKLHAAYSSRPAARVRLCDDEILSVRIDEINVPHSGDFATFAAGIRDALARRGSEPMFVQTWQRRLNQVHRFLYPRAPWLYPKQLFGFAPYDVILSLLPPVQTTGETLNQAVIYAGSDTGTAESCIFAATARSLTVTLWSGPDRRAHLAEVEKTSRDMGIATVRPWGRAVVGE